MTDAAVPVTTGLPAGDGPGLRDLDLLVGYDSAGDEALRDFYVPVLSRGVRYDRSVGYFRASAISVAARGISRFVANGGTLRLVCNSSLPSKEQEALRGATEVPDDLAERLASALVPPNEVARRRFEVLAWLAAQGRLEVKVAFKLDADDEPVVDQPGEHVGVYHEKLGLVWDHRGDGVAFQGSANETASAWTPRNFESFSVYRSWDGSAPYLRHWAEKFERRWRGEVPGYAVFDLPGKAEAVLRSYVPARPPAPRDPEEPPERADKRTLARFLAVAPRLVGAEALAEATSGVVLAPHQRKVAERLAGQYPRSWLVADEVGLGKTISAGAALRRLVLAGEVSRALVLAPANVCRQWQDELFEKFGLWVPRLDGDGVHGARPGDLRPLVPGENPYATEPVLVVSSHLARREAHQERILAAPRYDLVVVDEAHHARRRGADPDEYRPSRLLALLDRLRDARQARATWLLTATPMQIHPVELVDLLRHLGLAGPLARYADFARFHAELAKGEDDRTDWAYLARALARTPSLPPDAADGALLERIATKLGPVRRRRVERFGEPGADAVAEALGPDGRRELRAWLRQRGPIGQAVTRHTRETLRRYRDQGLLDATIADRDVEAVPVAFTAEEKALYADLDGLLDRLQAAHGARRGAGFVLTVYRRRLTSSWAAIARTLRRRLEAGAGADLEADLLDEAEEEGLDTGEGTTVDDAAAVPLTASDRTAALSYLERLARVADSKFDHLGAHLDEARGSGQRAIVFTQFADTLAYLRDRLRPAYRSHLATYSGAGGQVWSEEEQGWAAVSKADLVEALRGGQVSVVLATDAASEGLNLQAASYLVNYDLPWNPMRVEQRIGRIDRLGQARPVVTVRNYVVPGTVEEAVYAALASRIDLFAGLLGRLQPILGATEDAFRRIFRAPASERAAAQGAVVGQLLARLEELERTGIDVDDEDPLPDPRHLAPPVSLDGLHRRLTDDLDVYLDATTPTPERASRDPERFRALQTYGHPDLDVALRRLAGEAQSAPGPLVLRQAEGCWAAWRADRSPPEPVRSVADLVDLGEAVAAGEADRRARAESAAAAAARRERHRTVEEADREAWERGVRERFRGLVHRAVEAESAYRRRHGEGFVEPRLIWGDLLGDQVSGWANAGRFADHLGLEPRDLLPGAPAGADERSDAELRAVRARTGAELVALVKEWMAVALPPVPAPPPVSIAEQVGRLPLGDTL